MTPTHEIRIGTQWRPATLGKLLRRHPDPPVDVVAWSAPYGGLIVSERADFPADVVREREATMPTDENQDVAQEMSLVSRLAAEVAGLRKGLLQTGDGVPIVLRGTVFVVDGEGGVEPAEVVAIDSRDANAPLSLLFADGRGEGWANAMAYSTADAARAAGGEGRA